MGTHRVPWARARDAPGLVGAQAAGGRTQKVCGEQTEEGLAPCSRGTLGASGCGRPATSSSWGPQADWPRAPEAPAAASPCSPRSPFHTPPCRPGRPWCQLVTRRPAGALSRPFAGGSFGLSLQADGLCHERLVPGGPACGCPAIVVSAVRGFRISAGRRFPGTQRCRHPSPGGRSWEPPRPAWLSSSGRVAFWRPQCTPSVCHLRGSAAAGRSDPRRGVESNTGRMPHASRGHRSDLRPRASQGPCRLAPRGEGASPASRPAASSPPPALSSSPCSEAPLVMALGAPPGVTSRRSTLDSVTSAASVAVESGTFVGSGTCVSLGA